MRIFTRLALAASLSFVAACDDDDDDGGSSASSTTVATTNGESGGNGPSIATIQPILDANCTTGCHEAGGIWSISIYTEGESFDALAGATSSQSPLAMVEPGDAEMSYMWHKINGTHIGGVAMGSGTLMPQGPNSTDGTMLSAGDLATIRAWIDGGAAM